MKAYFDLTKIGIVFFILISASSGYFLSLQEGSAFYWLHFIQFLLGLYFVSSGSFILNQVQEWKRDSLMPRTHQRPIPLGKVEPWQASFLGVLFVAFGASLLNLQSPLSGLLSLLTVILYNGFYTLIWKRHWVFGAVPGAIPGAMPAVIGYAMHSDRIWDPACIYLFLIMFLWQMPHFWCLAIRYKNDYLAGGFPVLAVARGVETTLFHMGLYVFVYVGVALVSPWFLKTHILYILIVVPVALKVLWEFFVYYSQNEQKGWIKFFLWVNFSLIVFMGVPVADHWVGLMLRSP